MKLNLEHIHFQGHATERRGGVATRRIALGPVMVRTKAEEGEESPLPAVRWVLRQFGLAAEAYRVRALHRRVAACQRQLGARNADEIRTRLERQPALLASALNTLLIGVTEFFRDREVFARLEQEVLPELLGRRQRLRIYAPGVSTGEELYSVAMLLAEARVLGRCELTGVDCRPHAIAQARRGVFSDGDLATVPPSWRERYFSPVHGGWQAIPHLRERMRWATADLFAFAPPLPADLILFRNVAIYLSAEHAERAWTLLARQLAPGGWLITGRADKPPGHLPLVRIAPSVYRKPAS